MMQKIDVAILGATGAVGQRFIQLLENHPWFRVAEVVASDRSAGKSYAEATKWILTRSAPADVAGLTVLPLDAKLHSPLILSALPTDVAKTLELDLAAQGHVIASNTSSHRMADDVPLLIPEVNADHVHLIEAQRKKRGWSSGALVTTPNCTASPVVMALAPLVKYGVKSMLATSLQAVSGAGYPGVASLDIYDNVIPYIGGEEDKLETEPRKMLGAFAGDHIDFLPTRISAHCNRVPVIDGHIVCVSVAFERALSIETIRSEWAMYRGHQQVQALPSAASPILIYNELPDRPQPRRDRDLGHGMATVLGRLRPDPLFDVKFVSLAHNTIRGAAGGAILNAELLVQAGYLQGVATPALEPVGAD
jgi:aspartate-semialdehyde dehydrogenase